MKRLRGFAVDRGGLLGLAVLVLYIWLAPAHIVDGDNAEFATLARIGGVAHPSGYPLYLLWLRATTWLPGASPAHTAAIATAILGAASMVVLHAACRAWGARPLAATIAVAMFAAAPVVLRIETEAEVFALNGLIVAAVLWLAAADGPLRGARCAAALGLLAGLGLANHLTCVLVAPIGILGVVRAARQARPRVIAFAIAGLVVGLLPYLYVLVTPDTPMSWGKVDGLDDLWGLVTRRDYGGANAFLAHGQRAPTTTSLWAMVMTLGRSWLWAPLVVGLVTLGWRVARGPERWAWAMLALSTLLAGPVLASRFNTMPEGIGLYIVQRFHVLPALLLAIPVAVGLGALAARLPERARAWARPAAPIVATLGFAAVAGPSLSHVLRVHTAAVENGARNMLRSLPDGAVVIDAADDVGFGAGYIQWALGERRDVVMVNWGVMSLGWYRDRVAARDIVADAGPAPPSIRLAEHLLAVGRPLFVDLEMTEIIRAFPTYPYGTLVRVLSRGTRRPSLDEVVELNKALYGKLELAYPWPGPDDEWATIVHRRYAATWTTLGNALAAAGRSDDAEAAFAEARAIGPRS